MENDKAFPQPQVVIDGGVVSADELSDGGMSLRAYIATAIHAAVVQCGATMAAVGQDGKWTPEERARMSVEEADYLIAELAK